MFSEFLENVRSKSPLIHNITNYVTVNDVANALLAIGASPIMADDINEVEDITAICSSLNINIGTLNSNTIRSMILAGKKANELGHPVILDPVGAGASSLRTETSYSLLNNIKFTVVRGNISEIKTLSYGKGTTKGVDADINDAINAESLESAVLFAKDLSKKTGSIIAITGVIDIIADSEKAYCIYNGHPMMSRITGTGCMLSAIIAAYIASNFQKPLEATAAAVCAMGYSGEKAFNRLSESEGNSIYRNYIIDELFHLKGGELDRGAKYEIR